MRVAPNSSLLVQGDYVWTGSRLLRDAAVLAVDGEITDIGLREALQASYPDAVTVGGPGRIVLPGLINAHHHGSGITSFARGVQDDNLEPWLAALSVAPRVDPYTDTLLAALDTVQGGYATIVLFQSTGDPDSALDEAVARINACRAVGLRIAFGLDVMQRNFYVYGPDPQGLPPRRGLSSATYIGLLDELRGLYAADPLVQIFAAPSGPEWVTDDTWSAVGEWSRTHRLPLHTHALESPLQAEYDRRQFKDGLVARLDGLGALHEHTSLIHGVYLHEADFDRMAARGAHLITNPGSNLRLRCGVSPVLLALDRAVNVALGSDGGSLGDRDDALAELRLLFYLQRGVGIDTPALTWEQAMTMSTAAAARVTPWRTHPDAAHPVAPNAASRSYSDAAIGAIAPGLRADFSVYNLDSAAGPWHHPDLHPVHVLLHRAARQHLDAVVVDGRLVWDAQSGALLVDEQGAAVQVAQAIQQLEQTTQSTRKHAAEITAPDVASGPAIVTEYYRKWLNGNG